MLKRIFILQSFIFLLTSLAWALLVVRSIPHGMRPELPTHTQPAAELYAACCEPIHSRL